MNKKICLIYNYAQHYRTDIFKLIDQEIQCDFVFGDKMRDVKKMNYSDLTHFKKEVKNIVIFKPIYYQTGVLPLLFHNYETYIILGETICLSTWLMLFFSRLLNKKVYLWSHGWYGRESQLRKFINKIFFRMADGVFLYGNYAKQLMINEGIKEENLFVIYNSLAYDKQLKMRNKLLPSRLFTNHFKNNNPNLIFVGRLTPSKKFYLLLHALAKLKTKSVNFNFTLIGEGETKKELISLSNQLGLDENIWFYGACYDENKLSELIYNADMCVSPGNIGLTAIHSLAYGTPVLTHNNFPYQGPEFEAIEEGKTGIFFEYENSDDLADSIMRWFSTTPDREWVRKNCYEVIDKKYNPHFQIKVLKEVLS